MRKPVYRIPLWQKMLRKYRSIHIRIVHASDILIIKRLERKLEILRKRIISTNQKWAIGVATTVLTAWMSSPVAAQDTINLSTDLDGQNGETIAERYEIGHFDGDGLIDYRVGHHIIWGTGNPPELDVNNLSAGEYTTIKIPTPEIRNGSYDQYLVTTDFNNDGIRDLVCGVPSEYEIKDMQFVYYTYGRLLISLGGNGFRLDTLDMLQPNVNGKIDIYAEKIENTSFGLTIKSLGDVNGDGIEDIKFERNDPSGGSMFLYGGSVQPTDSINAADLTTAQATKATGHFIYPNTGDMNGDGFDDIIYNNYNQDKVTVIFGKEEGFGDSLTLDNSDGVELLGEPGDYFGYSATVLGDINHDGFNDIAIANYGYYSGNPETAYIIFGKSDWADTFSIADLNGSNGFAITDFPNQGIVSMNDYDGDGIDDFGIIENLNQLRIISGKCSNYSVDKPYTELQTENTNLIISNASQIFKTNNKVDYNQDGINDYLFYEYPSYNNRVLYGLPSEQKSLCNYAELNVLLIDDQQIYPAPKIEVKIPGIGSFYSNNEGIANIRFSEAGTYNLVPQNTDLITFVEDTVTVPILERGAVIDTTIYYTADTIVEDYSVKVSSGNRPRPGFDYNLTLEAGNEGTFDSPLGVETTLDLPDNYTVTSISDGGVQTGNQIVWMVSVPPFGLQKLYVEGAFNADANLGDQAFFFATINATSDTDVDFDNNFDELETEIVGSFDPNDKTAADTITPVSVQNGEFLEYLIRFQNTGTDTAFNVLVTDTLTNNLQWNTFELQSTSHTANVSRVDSILKFQFDDILLVDSTTNEPESHGFISFRIKPDSTLLHGDAIENEANIYFDFNDPVTTNNMITYVQAPIGIICENPIDITDNAKTNGWYKFNVDNASGSQFYSFTAAEDGYFRMSSCLTPIGTTYHTSLKVYEEDCGTLVGQAGNSCWGKSEFSGKILEGETYIFEWDNEEQGIFQARFYFYQPVTGIDCNDPVPLVEGLNTANYYLGPQYFSYTAEVPGTIHLSTCGLKDNAWDFYSGHGTLFNSCDNVTVLASSTECYDIYEDIQMELTYHVDTAGSSYILKLKELNQWYYSYNFEFTFTPDCVVDEVTVDSTVCDSIVFNGNTLSSSGTYFDIFTNQAGCDSLVTLNLTVNQSYNIEENISICQGEVHTLPDGSEVSSEGTYTSSLNTKAGCDSIITTILTVNQSYNIEENISICQGVVYTLPDGSEATTEGTYISSLNAEAGCDSIITTNITVKSVDVSVVEDGSTLSANEDGADSYQWLDCDNSFLAITGETNQSFTPGADGNFAVQISSGSCVDTSSCYSITVTGVIENSFGEQLKVYPNPTNGKLNIQLGENYNNVSVALRNELGQVIAVDEYSSTDQIWLDIQGNAGVYFLNIHTEDGQVATLKVLKN